MKKTFMGITGTLCLFYGIIVCNAQESSKTTVPVDPTAAKGAQGSVSVIDHWTFFREYIFDDNRSDFHPSDLEKSTEIARFVKANPTLKIGIDGFINQRTLEIDERRIATVRDLLISAGIPDSKIEKGSFGNPKSARKQRVAILIRTAN